MKVIGPSWSWSFPRPSLALLDSAMNFPLFWWKTSKMEGFLCARRRSSECIVRHYEWLWSIRTSTRTDHSVGFQQWQSRANYEIPYGLRWIRFRREISSKMSSLSWTSRLDAKSPCALRKAAKNLVDKSI